MEKIKIIIADDHKLVRDGLKSLIHSNEDFEVIAEAGDGNEVLELIKHHQADVVLLDISMPGKSGLEAYAIIKETNPEQKVILLTMHADPDYIVRGMQLGINGYLLKDVEQEEFETAIRKVACGDKYFNSTISSIMIENMSKFGQDKDASILSNRELQVLQMVANGLSTKVIADELSLSTRTIESHRLNIMKKLHVSNTAELVKKSIEKKLI